MCMMRASKCLIIVFLSIELVQTYNYVPSCHKTNFPIKYKTSRNHSVVIVIKRVLCTFHFSAIARRWKKIPGSLWVMNERRSRDRRAKAKAITSLITEHQRAFSQISRALRCKPVITTHCRAAYEFPPMKKFKEKKIFNR